MAAPIIARGSLGGRAVRNFDAAGFIFTETRHPPLLSLPRHANDRATVIAVLRGDYGETLGGQARRHAPGTLILRPPGEVHSNAIGRRGAHCLLIELTASRFESMRDHAALFERPRTIDPGLGSPAAVRAARELATLDAASPLALESLALEMLAQVMRRSPRAEPRVAPTWLERVRDMLDNHGRETALTLTEVARAVDLHPVYVARAFRARWGCSIGEYARRTRIAWACEQLADSDLTLSDIAAAAGFHDQSHFSRVFRRHTALSPAAFRRALHQGSVDANRVRRVLDGRGEPRHS